jgi:hypothetical protein
MEGDTSGREEVEAGGAHSLKINDSNKCHDSLLPSIASPKPAVKMPKRRKTFGRSQKKSGNRKLGDGGEGFFYIPPIAPTRFDTRGTSIKGNHIKYIPKKTLFRQLQQMEVNILTLVDRKLVAQYIKLTTSLFYPTDSMPTCTGTGSTAFQ